MYIYTQLHILYISRASPRCLSGIWPLPRYYIYYIYIILYTYILYYIYGSFSFAVVPKLPPFTFLCVLVIGHNSTVGNDKVYMANCPFLGGCRPPTPLKVKGVRGALFYRCRANEKLQYIYIYIYTCINMCIYHTCMFVYTF